MEQFLTHPFWFALGNALITSLWQGLVIFLLAWPLISLSEKRHPAMAHIISMTALTIMFATFIFSLIKVATSMAAIPGQQAVSMEMALEPISLFTISATEQGTANNPAPFSFLKPYLPWLALLYLCGLIFFSLKYLTGIIRVKKLRTTGLSPFPEFLQIIADNAQALSGVSQKVSFYLSKHINSPVCLGYFKPIILFPVSAATNLSAEEIEMIILHELAHIKRHDYLFKVYQNTLHILLFFNPFCHLLVNRANLTREICCDHQVLALKKENLHYANTLLKLEELRNSKPILLAMKSNQNQLIHRIKNIMENKTNTPPTALVTLAIVVMAAISLSWYNHEIKKDKPAESSHTMISNYESDKNQNFDENGIMDTPENLPKAHEAANLEAAETTLPNEISEPATAIAHLDPLPSSSPSVSRTVETEDHGNKFTTRGLVHDHKGKPLAGTMISVPGTSIAAISSLDGTFTLEGVEAGQEIVVTMIGFERKTARAEPDAYIEIWMSKSTQAPMVMLVSTSSDDSSSRTENYLFVLDGEITERETIFAMAPAEILTMNMYKGDRAVELFGVAANNKEGVLEIISRKGREKGEHITQLEDRIAHDPDLKDTQLITTVEEIPRFSKGSYKEWFLQNMQYPEEAKSNNLEGTVHVDFVILKDGTVDQVSIHQGDHQVFFQEAIRLVKSMPPWIPGKQRGEPVDVRMILPIEFSLN